VKSICTILILALVLHAQCGVECLGADPEPVPAKPACHEHASDLPGAPSGDDSSQHSGNPCGRAQLLDSQNLAGVKCSLQWMKLEAADAVITLQLEHPQTMAAVSTESLFNFSSFPKITVLRI
jgi:hypothetical protein